MSVEERKILANEYPHLAMLSGFSRSWIQVVNVSEVGNRNAAVITQPGATLN